MSKVWDDGPAKQGSLLVMLALADYSNDAGECWPSIKSIAHKARMTERGVQKILRNLEAENWLEIDTGNGRHGCNNYRINPERRNTPEQGSPRTSITETPNVDAETPNVGTPEPSLTINEPSVDTPIIPKPPPPKPKRAVSIPDNWVPSDENYDHAISKTLNHEEIQNEADRFRDYHLAKGTTFKDWDAGWRTWVGNAVKYRNRSMVGQQGSRGFGQGGSIASTVARRHAGG